MYTSVVLTATYIWCKYTLLVFLIVFKIVLKDCRLILEQLSVARMSYTFAFTMFFTMVFIFHFKINDDDDDDDVCFVFTRDST